MNHRIQHHCGLGWNGFRGRPMPIVVMILFCAYVLTTILWTHRDVLNRSPFDKSTLLAVYGLLVFILRTPYDIFRSQRSMRELGMRLAVLIILVLIFVVSLTLFLAVPTGTAKDVLIVTGWSSAIASLGWLFFSDRIRDLGAKIRQFTDSNYSSWRGSSWSWIPDLGIWVLLTIAATLGTAATARLATVLTNRTSEDSSASLRWAPIVAAIVCYLYQSVFTSRRGTLGQALSGVRIVRQDDFEPLSSRVAFLRTLVVSAPAIAFFVLVAINSEPSIDREYSPQDIAEIVAIIVLFLGLAVGGISKSIIRPEHPHGQGLADLLTKTICVPEGVVKHQCNC